MHEKPYKNKRQNLSQQGPSAQPWINTLSPQNHALNSYKKTEFLYCKTESMSSHYNKKTSAKTTTSRLTTCVANALFIEENR